MKWNETIGPDDQIVVLVPVEYGGGACSDCVFEDRCDGAEAAQRRGRACAIWQGSKYNGAWMPEAEAVKRRLKGPVI